MITLVIITAQIVALILGLWLRERDTETAIVLFTAIAILAAINTIIKFMGV